MSFKKKVEKSVFVGRPAIFLCCAFFRDFFGTPPAGGSRDSLMDTIMDNCPIDYDYCVLTDSGKCVVSIVPMSKIIANYASKQLFC